MELKKKCMHSHKVRKEVVNLQLRFSELPKSGIVERSDLIHVLLMDMLLKDDQKGTHFIGNPGSGGLLVYGLEVVELVSVGSETRKRAYVLACKAAFHRVSLVVSLFFLDRHNTDRFQEIHIVQH